MQKITYILGAGASANVLPLIKDQPNKPGLPTMLKSFIDEFITEFSEMGDDKRPSKEELQSIGELLIKFQTPDLLAKYYLEKGDLRKYSILKNLMSKLFINLEDNDNLTGATIDKDNIDPRIITFLSTISTQQKLPENIKIISWNYDRQIEKGATKLRPEKGNEYYIRNFKVWPSNEKQKIEPSQYFLMHLNGIAGQIYSEQTFIAKEHSPKIFKQVEPLISFAWEDDESFGKSTFSKNRMTVAKEMIVGTEIMVVIGYSFPFFNRKVDTELFETVKGSLKKIYFQDPKLDGSFLYNQFGIPKEDSVDPLSSRITRKIDIIHIKDVDNYYVPYEL